MAKRSTSIRITEDARTIMKRLSAKLGISEAAVIEIALRLLADREALK